MTAISLLPGEKEENYEKWMIQPWTRGLSTEPWDAIYASHFIEHLDDQDGFLSWCAENLKPGGKLYLEWPSVHSRELPGRQILEQATGLKLSISAFKDDPTHKEMTPASNVFASHLRNVGMEIEQEGAVSMPYFTDKLLQDFFAGADGYCAQAAWFLKTQWCTYIVARKAHS
jgi:SAM-dependent methyltransferase